MTVQANSTTTIEAVFFDLDDVLLDYDYRMRTRVRNTYQTVATHLPTALRQAAIEATSALIRDLMDRHAWDEREQIEWFADPLGRLGINDRCLAQSLCDEIDRRFDQANRLYPAGRRMLEASADRKRCLITNGYGNIQRAKLRQLGLEDGVFDAVFICGEIDIWKPDRRVFEMALEVSGSVPSRTVMVGDNPYTDVAGAASAGIRSIWINHGHLTLGSGDARPTWEVGSVDAAADLLEGLLAA